MSEKTSAKQLCEDIIASCDNSSDPVLQGIARAYLALEEKCGRLEDEIKIATQALMECAVDPYLIAQHQIQVTSQGQLYEAQKRQYQTMQQMRSPRLIAMAALDKLKKNR